MCKGLATLPATCLKSAKDIKHKISFLLQKPEPQAAEPKQIKEKAPATTAADKSVATAADVEQWKESFSHVMSSQTGVRVFRNFLKSEFSEENIDFWIACEEFKKTSPSKMATRAKQIYQQFIEPDAPHEVNLDAATREQTRENIEKACGTCFDEAQKMIYNLMEKDSYRRFLKSKPIQDLTQMTSNDATQEKKWDCAENKHTLAGGA